MNDTRTIRVTGKGRVRVHPDMTRITMTLTGLYPEYGDALSHSSEDTEKLAGTLAPFSFTRTDLKTLSFSVDTEYEGYQQKGVYKQRFLGYRFNHLLKVEFESDNDRLGQVLYALANSPIAPEFRISYMVKDTESVKNTLLGNAVADAKAKAAVLTQAAGVTLKDIRTIDYSFGEIEFEVRPMPRNIMYAKSMEADAAGSYDMDIEPDDIDVSDTVTVVWEIG